MDGDVLAFAVLARRLGPDQPSYGLRVPGIDDGTTVQSSFVEMAREYVADIRQRATPGAVRPRGVLPRGTLVAVEMASQLETPGEQVAMLVLLDRQVRDAGRSPLQAVGGPA